MVRVMSNEVFELLEQQQKVLVAMSKQLDSISSVLETMAKILTNR